MRFLELILRIAIFCLLTILTQIGGVTYLISLFTYKFTISHTRNKFSQWFLKTIIFLIIYLFATFVIVPFIAKPFGRVPLPIAERNNLRPLNILTCILNRNYVRPELKQTALEVAREMNNKFPGTTVNYLDGNFPFIDKFPLIPHLSHNDGKKLDLAFCYTDAKTGKQTNNCPSFIGYGICEDPLPDEKNTADFCKEKGYLQYSVLKAIVPQGNKKEYLFDSERTIELVNLFTSKNSIGKIFIEPHLKTRLHLTSNKIRFHGCQAVRHDYHIHIQL
jgi:hypothetical protein